MSAAVVYKYFSGAVKRNNTGFFAHLHYRGVVFVFQSDKSDNGAFFNSEFAAYHVNAV